MFFNPLKIEAAGMLKQKRVRSSNVRYLCKIKLVNADHSFHNTHWLRHTSNSHNVFLIGLCDACYTCNVLDMFLYNFYSLMPGGKKTVKKTVLK